MVMRRKTVVLKNAFSYIIEQAYLKTGKGVVVLVDEYDKPLLQALLDENLLDEYRRILKAFYGVLKVPIAIFGLYS